MLDNITQDTLAEVKKSFSQPTTPTSGLQTYNLEAPSKKMIPVNTPLRNKIARVKATGGIQANWKVMTGININNTGIGIAQGKRGNKISHSVVEKYAAFRFCGLEDSATFEAEYAAEGYEDILATLGTNLLNSTMIQEEFLDYAGNGTLVLAKPSNLVLTTATTGGAIAANTSISVRVVALSQTGWQQVAGWNNGTTGQKLDIAFASLTPVVQEVEAGTGAVVSVNGGTSVASDAVAISVGTGNKNSVVAQVDPVVGAFGYAWFFGPAGSEVLGAVTNISAVVITTAVGANSNVEASDFVADRSKNDLVYDGILTQICTAGSGSYYKALPVTNGVGSKLTSDGANGVVEIEEALAQFYQLYKLSPEEMFVSAGVFNQISKLIVANGGGSLYRVQSTDLAAISGGIAAGSVVYQNKYTGTILKISVHPNAAPGTILFYSNKVPYPLAGVNNVVQKLLRRDYHMIEWPLRTREREYGVYFDGVLQCYFTPAFGLITNILE